MTAAQTSMQSSRGARSDMNHTNGKEHACNERPLSAPKSNSAPSAAVKYLS